MAELSNILRHIVSSTIPASSLWPRLCGHVAVARCDLPLLSGFVSYRTSRGNCKIWCASPNLWFVVAVALGFHVISLCFLSPPFVALVSTFWLGASVLAVKPRCCNPLPNVVSLDLLSLPLDAGSLLVYWRSWHTPHVFFCLVGDLDVEAWGACRPSQMLPSPPRG
jgi:hypothetical protein